MAWDAPASVGAFLTTRAGGVSAPPHDAFNLAGHTGDAADAVAANRRRLAGLLGVRPVWLQQVHGAQVVRAGSTPAGTAASSLTAGDAPVADACWTDEPGVACTVLVADCLPVLFSARDGRAVAAAHAGWRGLALGVLEATLAALGQGAGLAPDEIVAWLGPCIGPERFEVGPDVLRGFGVDPVPGATHPAFRYRPRPDGDPRWRADLAGLAADRLARAGVSAVARDGRCTVNEASAFFSFRRDGVTGRFAAGVWRR